MYLNEKDKFDVKRCTFTIRRSLFSFKFQVNRIESLLTYSTKNVLSCLVNLNRFSILNYCRGQGILLLLAVTALHHFK